MYAMLGSDDTLDFMQRYDTITPKEHNGLSIFKQCC